MSILAGVLGASAGLGVISGAYSAYKNYQSQSENLGWQKKAQKIIWTREDNAARRRVADLRAAGLSPTLAAGDTARAGQVVQTNPPQVDTSGMNNALSNAMQLMKMQADISLTEAQKKLMVAQTSKAYSESGNIKARKEQFEKDVQNFGHGYGPTWAGRVGSEATKTFENITGVNVKQTLKNAVQDVKKKIMGRPIKLKKGKPRKGLGRDLEIMKKQAIKNLRRR